MNIERYFGTETLHPAIPAMGWSTQSQAREGLEAHFHPHYEIVLIEKGSVDWFIENRLHRLTAPCTFFTRPQAHHGSPTGRIQPSTFGWFQIIPEKLNPDHQSLLTKISWERASLSKELKSVFNLMLNEVRKPSLTSALMMESLLGQALIFLTRLNQPENTPHYSPSVQKVMEAIEAHPDHPWSNPELEGIAGLGHSQLNQNFKNEVGSSPRAYALSLRLKEAHRRIRKDDDPITKIAFDLGFSSSQHFSSTFRKHFGITPSQCKKEKGF